MALIQCKVCGKTVSDKAKVCPGCGTDLSSGIEEVSPQETQPIICEECGTEIPIGADTCPNCGCPVEDAPSESSPVQKVELAAVNLPQMKPGTKKGIIIGAAAAVLLVILIMIGVNSHNKGTAAKISAEYSENLSSVSLSMLLGAGEAEDAGNLIRKVWYNSIHEERDPETDSYTRPKGYFYDDFNDALRELFSDSSFQSKISSIENNQESVAELMKALRNPPEEYEEAYDAVKDCYDAYLSLTNLAISPTGSLQTYTTSFNDADTKTLNAYNALKLYLDD